ncbi:HNH endonuclease signature motif containing protein, partial [Microbacterium sp.]|uniref:HNH endonuclease signature motif containing protein n=1 Tax=Microbacterium sp. TaxID=51671 RepID=UPI002FE287CF
MDSTEETLERVVADLDRVLSGDGFGLLSDDAKMQVLRLAGEAQRRLDAVVVETVASVPARPSGSGDLAFCGQFGCRTMNELLQRVLRVDAYGAGRVVKAASSIFREEDLSSGGWQTARWPRLRQALLEGTIGIAGLLAAVGPVDEAQRRVGAVQRWRADAQLAALARGLVAVEDPDAAADGVAGDSDAAGALEESGPPATPEDLRAYARVIMAYLDPDGAEPAEEIAMRGRGIRFGRAKHGLVPIHGDLLPETAGALQRQFDAYLNPKVDGPPLPGVRFVDSENGSDGGSDSEGGGGGGSGSGWFGGGQSGSDGASDWSGSDERQNNDVLPSGDAGGMVDTRTRPQQQHDAFAAILGIAARHDDMPKLGGAAPTLIVSVTAEDYATGRGWAHVDGIDTPVSVATARHTACGGTIQRVLFDPEGRIIGIGVTDRIFTTPQRRAITLRDKECLIPGCHVPASWCEIHHVQEHARGGPTHTDNGVALCWHHHRTLDTSGWEIRMDNGTPHVRGPAWWDPARRWRTPQP